METHFAKAMGEDASEHILRERIHELRRLAVQSQEARDHGPTVVDDDLTWLSGPADPVVIGPAATAKEQLAEATETDTSLRMMYSDLRNDTLRRELKLEALTNELLTLQREAIDTPQERRHITSRQQTLKEVQERVAEMELKALQAQDYTETLQLVYNRLNRTKHVGEEAVAAVKSQMEDIERQIEIHHQRQRAMTHAAWQERKAAGLNLELVAAQGRMRRKLKEQRRMVLDQRTKSQEEEEAEARAKAAEMAQGLRQQKIGALLGQASWSTLKGNVDRLARLEEQFDKLGELMGFGTLDEVVERCLAQQEKISRMKLAEEEARARVAQLTEHKAQIDIQYEEQVGGVDSELHKRRHEYDRLVALVASKQEHGAHQRAKLDAVQRALVHAQTGLSHLAERVATARGVSLHPVSSVPTLPRRQTRESESVQAARSAQLGHSFIGGVRDDESRRSASSFPEESFSRGDERLRRIEQSALACLAMCEAELVNTLNDVTRMQAAANSTEDKLWFSKEGEQFESRQRVGSAGWGEESGQVVGSTHGVMQLRDSTRDSLNCKISPLAAPSRRWNALSQYNARVDYEDGSSTEGGSCTDSAIGRLNQNVEDWIVERQELRQQALRPAQGHEKGKKSRPSVKQSSIAADPGASSRLSRTMPSRLSNGKDGKDAGANIIDATGGGTALGSARRKTCAATMCGSINSTGVSSPPSTRPHRGMPATTPPRCPRGTLGASPLSTSAHRHLSLTARPVTADSFSTCAARSSGSQSARDSSPRPTLAGNGKLPRVYSRPSSELNG